ncbi:tRNA adenosine(34) deaminase TadA [Desulfovibrio sp.]|uniref:tRNA adenosine(34) deaminase TadA n=1 Tax=Desulfovibrio sp. TaxID=885 RepID=UPI0025C07EF5|nr:tRNA adenosine(34) deaminase TadA [Desulfovibrio sp.]MCI7568435.1 tRNA adenosine(34) deaminase TadA [Desulfovibrio sp.]
MSCAQEEAARAANRNEVPVGALVAHADGRVLARAGNEPLTLHDPTAHAEILALRRAGAALGNYRLNDCVLVVTLEPCAMCAAALVHARIDGVVFGAADAVAGAVLSCDELFSRPYFNHRVWHMGGIRAEACAAQLRAFFAERRSG